MSRLSLFIDVAVAAFWWIMLLLGIFTKNEWLFGPAAFFILLDAVGDR